MSNPHTFHALQQIGLVPENAVLLEGNADPFKIELRVSPSMIPLEKKREQEKLENN